MYTVPVDLMGTIFTLFQHAPMHARSCGAARACDEAGGLPQPRPPLHHHGGHGAERERGGGVRAGILCGQGAPAELHDAAEGQGVCVCVCVCVCKRERERERD